MRFNRRNQGFDGNFKNNSGGNWVQQKGSVEDKPNSRMDMKPQGTGDSNITDDMANSGGPGPQSYNSTPLQNRLGGKFNNPNSNNKMKNEQMTSTPKDSNPNNTTPRKYDQHAGNFDNQNHGNRNNQNSYHNRRGGQGGGPRNSNRGPGGYQDRIKDRVNRELSGPQYDLPSLTNEEKKFNSQCRLFIGNLSRDVDPEDIKAEFAKFGELGQVYFNKESAYGFINFDYKLNADKAVAEMQGKVINGRPLTVRFATVNSGIKVKNLTPCVSNELLAKAFSVFGEIETCKVTLDGRGKPTGEGFIIFTEKKAANIAIKKCDEDCYFLTSSLRPVVVEPLESTDEGEGQPEATIAKNEAYRKEREIGPHFADQTSFQYEYGLQWKQLFFLYNEKKTALERDFLAECDALCAKLSLVKHEYETEQLRRELAAREAESSYLQAEAEYRMSTASFSTFHSSSPAAGGGNYEDNRSFDRYDRGGYDRGYNNRGNYGYDNAGSQSFDTSFNQGSDRNYDQGYSRNRDMNPAPSGGAGNTSSLDDPTANNRAVPSRLAGRLQDRRAADPVSQDQSTPAVAPQAPSISQQPPAEEPVISRPMEHSNDSRSTNTTQQSLVAENSLGGVLNRLERAHNVEDLNRSLPARQDHGDLNRSLSTRQDLNRSLNSRQDNMDLGRSLSTRQDGYMGRQYDRPHQGDQPIKRIRY